MATSEIEPKPEQKSVPDSLDAKTVQLIRSSDTHFSGVVAPLLVAFTLPTVALIVTTRDWPADEALRSAVLGLLVTSTGLLLASSQLSVGALLKPDWSSPTRAGLSY